MQLFKKQINFLNFFAFLKSILNFKHFPKDMTPIADAFPELPSPKYVVI